MELKELKQIKLNEGDKKIMKTKIKQEKGITLIALVVTIVVLLILAGVSVNAIFNDNGIIKKAQDAQNKMNEAQNKDLDAINVLDKWIDNQVNATTQKKIISFTINGVACQAEEGMTWREWGNSKYCYSDCDVVEEIDGIMYRGMYTINSISLSDKILENGTYTAKGDAQ